MSSNLWYFRMKTLFRFLMCGYSVFRIWLCVCRLTQTCCKGDGMFTLAPVNSDSTQSGLRKADEMT